MSTLGKSTLSIRKQDLATQRSPSIGFKKLKFWHKASAGDTSINLLNLSMPSEMSALGLSNPSGSALAAANLYFFKENFSLISSVAGQMQYGSYTVGGSTSITLAVPALADEIFEGTIDYSMTTGTNLVDSMPILATGTLLAGQTDIAVGVPFEINKYPDKQIGVVMLFLDGYGTPLFRNVGNSSTGEGDYYEVNSGSGIGNVLRLNSSSASDRPYVVTSVVGYAERPSSSMMAYIESINGAVNSMKPYLADVTGVDQSAFGNNPSSVDLATFGNTVAKILSATVPIVTSETLAGTSVIEATSNPTKGTVTKDNVYTLRMMDKLKIRWEYSQSAAGTSGSGNYLFKIPNGLTIDTSKISTGGNGALTTVGTFAAFNGTNFAKGNVTVADSTHLAFHVLYGSGTYGGVGFISGSFFGLASTGALEFSFDADVPIYGWTATQTIKQQLGL